MKTIEEIYQRAADRKGGEAELKKVTDVDSKTAKQLSAISDDRYLSGMTKAVFKAGFVWRVIENKWDGFENAFWQFNINRCAYMSPDDIDDLSQDTRIVRNTQKIVTVQANAVMIFELARKHGGFGAFIAEWPEDDYIGLLNYLKKHGSRLGGMSCQYFLRTMGKDGFIMSRDGTAALIDAGVVDKAPTGKAAMQKVQDAYNQWHQETGFGYAKLSRILACSIDAHK